MYKKMVLLSELNQYFGSLFESNLPDFPLFYCKRILFWIACYFLPFLIVISLFKIITVKICLNFIWKRRTSLPISFIIDVKVLICRTIYLTTKNRTIAVHISLDSYYILFIGTFFSREFFIFGYGENKRLSGFIVYPLKLIILLPMQGCKST